MASRPGLARLAGASGWYRNGRLKSEKRAGAVRPPGINATDTFFPENPSGISRDPALKLTHMPPDPPSQALVSTRDCLCVKMHCMKYLPTSLGIDLQNAYAILVKGFGKSGSSTAPGPGATVAGLKPASFAQKLWRFCIHPLVVESALIEPMHQAIRQEVADHPGVLLAIHDWSTLSFADHPSKTDRATLTHADDVGYDLATVLMVRGDDGAPIAPALVSLTTADGVLSTRGGDPAPDICHIDQVRGDMQYVSDLDLGTTLVHVIDREADSVDHWRQWSVDGHLALVRGDDRRVLCQGKESSLVAVAEGFRQGDAFQDAGTAGFTAVWRGCTSPRPRSSCTGPADGTWAKRRSTSPGRRCRCGWSSPRSATRKDGCWPAGCC